MSEPIVCAIRTPDNIHTVTVVNEGEINTDTPSGVDVTSTVSKEVPSNYGIFYVFSADPGGPQGIVVEDGGLGFTIYTYDGLSLNFNDGVGGADDATCPIHTDATWTNAWETFTFTQVPNPPANQHVPPEAVPYYIQTKAGYYLESVKDSSESKTQPVYKSSEESNSIVNFVPISTQVEGSEMTLAGTNWILSKNDQGVPVSVPLKFQSGEKCNYGPYDNCTYTEQGSNFVVLVPIVDGPPQVQETKLAGTFTQESGEGTLTHVPHSGFKPDGVSIPFTLRRIG